MAQHIDGLWTRDKMGMPGTTDTDTDFFQPTKGPATGRPRFCMEVATHAVLGAGVKMFFEGAPTHEFVPAAAIRRITFREIAKKEKTDK